MGKLTQLSNGVWTEDGYAITFSRATNLLNADRLKKFIEGSEGVIVGRAVYTDNPKVHLTADWASTLCGIELDNISTPANNRQVATCKSCMKRYERYTS